MNRSCDFLKDAFASSETSTYPIVEASFVLFTAECLLKEYLLLYFDVLPLTKADLLMPSPEPPNEFRGFWPDSKLIFVDTFQFSYLNTTSHSLVLGISELQSIFFCDNFIRSRIGLRIWVIGLIEWLGWLDQGRRVIGKGTVVELIRGHLYYIQ